MSGFCQNTVLVVNGLLEIFSHGLIDMKSLVESCSLTGYALRIFAVSDKVQ